MKLSISWIFSHINCNWQDINIIDLVEKFNKTTAEIESIKKIYIDLNQLYLAKIVAIESENVILFCAEISKEIELPKRDNSKKEDIFLIKKNNDESFRWARTSDLGSEKDQLIPVLCISENLQKGEWKKSFAIEDYVLEVDNKSITHRPDLWGHRGFAREIAAIFNLELLPIDNFITKPEVIESEKELKFENLCKRFATVYLNQIKNRASDLDIAVSLCKIDSKPINAIVDATNFVMFDLGQPMHAFDAEKIQGKKIGPRLAIEGENLKLLDDQIIELSGQDLIISDEQNPLALAGIMGGKNSEVTENTKSILVESACFDASTIRKSAIRHKTRTEASARFEKSLDPQQNIIAIERFLKVLKVEKNELNSAKIVSLGEKPKEIIINIDHNFIEQRLGVKIKPDFIINILKKLDFKVQTYPANSTEIHGYKIYVPTFRSTKDVLIPEDIVEEIGRFFGYGNIPFILPSKQMIPNDLDQITNIKKIKELMAFANSMHEVQNYPFYDESYLNELSWQPANFINVINPVSENWKKLVTSLIPHLLKNIQQNLNKSNKLNFFELNRIWSLKNKISIEKKSLAGIIFDEKQPVDFYQGKANLTLLFDLLKLKIDWIKPTEKYEWYSRYQTADLIYENNKIGIAGNIDQAFLNKISQGDAFIFELDGDFLLEYMPKITKFEPLPKFPIVWLDLSMFVTLDKTVDQIISIIKNSDPKIFKVELVDQFEKNDWVNKKSLAFRFYFVDENRTMTKNEIDEVMNKVINDVKNIGAEIR